LATTARKRAGRKMCFSSRTWRKGAAYVAYALLPFSISSLPPSPLILGVLSTQRLARAERAADSRHVPGLGRRGHALRTAIPGRKPVHCTFTYLARLNSLVCTALTSLNAHFLEAAENDRYRRLLAALSAPSRGVRLRRIYSHPDVFCGFASRTALRMSAINLRTLRAALLRGG